MRRVTIHINFDKRLNEKNPAGTISKMCNKKQEIEFLKTYKNEINKIHYAY